MIAPRPRTLTRYWAWYAGVLMPRAVAGRFVSRPPVVHGFSASGRSALAEALRRINTLLPTEFCRVMTRHGSDKGRLWHNYTTVYATLLADLRRKPLRIFELGLGTDNPELVSTMGSNGRPGASLRGWRDLFPNAMVFGADIDRRILFYEERIATFYCDQLDHDAIRALWERPELQGGMDLLIEDGLHTFEANQSFLDGSLEKVRPGGFYVVEDIGSETLSFWRDILHERYAPMYPTFDFALMSLPNAANTQDNNMLVARRDTA